eukprot:m.8200 g.8200  ORF g.8200 m.8200 type:complete len:400 (-) comp3853_c0_seq1:103-1302(-)
MASDVSMDDTGATMADKPSAAEGDANDSTASSDASKIHRHTTPWPVYATSWSQKGKDPFRLAVGSFVEEYRNKIQLVRLDPDKGKFTEIDIVDHPYPATKIQWMPDQTNQFDADLMATTGDYLRLWRVDGPEGVKQESLLNSNKSELFCAPLTSFDWCEHNPRLIGTSSIDTTCTIWNIEVEKRVATVPGTSTTATSIATPAAASAADSTKPKRVTGDVRTQLIAHDQEVYDIAFRPGEDNIFASVGADGSVRMFDLRSLKHSRIIYEEENEKQLLRLAWNKCDKNYLATMKLDSKEVTILDLRSPPRPAATLGTVSGHSAGVNGIAWAPNSSYYICTAGDDKKALIWDISSSRPNVDSVIEPCLAYDAGGPINQVNWSAVSAEWIAISYDKTLEVLRV